MSSVLVSHENQTLTLTINRPEKGNALNNDVVSGLRAAIAKAQSDRDLRALVLTAAGTKFFCAGGDLGEFKNSSFADQLQSQRDYMELLKELRQFNRPTIAKVQGTVRGGGIGLTLACDLVFASETASFGTPEVKVGLFPMMVSALLFRELPKNVAFDMLYTGRTLTAQQALKYDLIKQVTPESDLSKAVKDTIAELRKLSPLTLKLGKTAIAATRDETFVAAVETLNAYLTINLQSADAQEGLAAFLQKRKPEWRGE